MSCKSPVSKSSEPRRSRALKVGAAFALGYLLLGLILLLFLQEDPFLLWLFLLWLFVNGPGALVVSAPPLHAVTMLVYAIGFGVNVLFYFIAGATTAYVAKFRWAVLTVWAIVAIASGILSLYINLLRLAEPIA